ncbi:hypothetical protein MU1_24090 [Paenibacillus glycanilyticus]|uniref:N-acetyltransferase domain-containing protein n=2 Tax=Paenibacillus glycanilyticus TaxID=126569 RepID=A0ABQ6GAT7_9BACL|nr:hypothetical protein MU1_24090 [Paenibacillus glycanilyticus]
MDSQHLYEVSLTRKAPTVIEYNKEPVGYSTLYDVEEGSGWLGNVIISKHHRRIGAARYLIETMVNRAKEQFGVRELHLVCHNTNTKALLLYHQIGFKPYDLRIVTNEEKVEIAGVVMKLTL